MVLPPLPPLNETSELAALNAMLNELRRIRRLVEAWPNPPFSSSSESGGGPAPGGR